jgi:protein SCO1/2
MPRSSSFPDGSDTPVRLGALPRLFGGADILVCLGRMYAAARTRSRLRRKSDRSVRPTGRDGSATNLQILRLLLATLLLNASTLRAQQVSLPPSSIYSKIGVDQKLNDQVPLDLLFRDESGAAIPLSTYFHHDRPVVLALVYYKCPMLCTMTLNGMLKSFKPLKLDIGKDFDVLTVSFDPNETPDLAAAKKATHIKSYNRPGADKGWHFLTGEQDSIDKLTRAVGFRYTYDPASKQFAHTSAIMILTPDGKISRYFYGLEYSSRDLRLGLIEASQNKIGTLTDAVVLLCFHYDPASAKYGLVVMNLLRAGGILTLIILGSYIVTKIRRERHLAPLAPSPGIPGEGLRPHARVN